MANPDFKQVTDGCPSGSGVFDELMRSVKAHLQEEYDAQRIRGSEYTQAYTAALQGAMQQAIQWQLQAAISENQALLIAEQIEGQNLQNKMIVEQTEQVEAQTELTNVNKDNAIAQGALIPKQGLLLDEQIEGAGLQNQMITQQTLTEEQNTANAEQTYLTTKFNVEEMLPAQKAIYDQKLITEQAQTQDTSINGSITGVTGAQKDLYRKQIEGFDRDAEQKAARVLTDTYAVVTSADLSGDSIPTSVGKTNVDTVLNTLTDNAGLTN